MGNAEPITDQQLEAQSTWKNNQAVGYEDRGLGMELNGNAGAKKLSCNRTEGKKTRDDWKDKFINPDWCIEL